MSTFLLAAALLVALTLVLLLRPWRRRADAAASAREVNAGLYRDQLREIDRDLAAGTLSEADHGQARAELQRRLLDDAQAVGASDAPVSVVAPARTTMLGLAIALPLLAAGLYLLLGTPAALDPRARQGVTQADVEQMVAALAARLESKPDDPKGWIVLARSYRAMGRLQEAQAAFARIGPELDRDPTLLAEYADVLGSLGQGDLQGRPSELVARALKIDPDNALALALAATAAFNRDDRVQAALLWERLLKRMPADSEDAQWVRARLAETRGERPLAQVGAPDAAASAGMPAPTAKLAAAPAAIAAPGTVGAGTSEVTATAIRGQVRLAPQFAAQVRPDDTVFVFARAAQGLRMPLAVQRTRVAELPFSFQLDDAQAMSPELRLSGAVAVRIEARISRSGSATPAAGDLIGEGPVVKPGARGVEVVIDHVRP